MDAFTAAIFDMDGLLLDSERAIMRAWTAAARDEGLELSEHDYLRTVGRSLRDSLDAFGADGFVCLRDRWQALNAHAGKPVRVVSEFAVPVEGICVGVDVDGALLLETAVCVQRILSGDVSLRSA